MLIVLQIVMGCWFGYIAFKTIMGNPPKQTTRLININLIQDIFAYRVLMSLIYLFLAVLFFVMGMLTNILETFIFVIIYTSGFIIWLICNLIIYIFFSKYYKD